jgi:hypothetical protein
MKPQSALVDQLYQAALERIEAIRQKRANIPEAIVDFQGADRESCIAFGALLSEELLPRIRDSLTLTDAQALVLLLDLGFGLAEVAVYDNRGGLEVVATPREDAFTAGERDSLRLALLVCVESFVSGRVPGSVLIAGGTEASISVRAIHPIAAVPQPAAGPV